MLELFLYLQDESSVIKETKSEVVIQMWKGQPRILESQRRMSLLLTKSM